MLEAVVFLKDLQSQGLVIEVSRGVWLRAPALSEATQKTPGDYRFVSQSGIDLVNISALDKTTFTDVGRF